MSLACKALLNSLFLRRCCPQRAACLDKLITALASQASGSVGRVEITR